MNKELLYKYFDDNASEQEIDQIISWVEESPKNLIFFAEQKVLWDISGKKENYSIRKITDSIDQVKKPIKIKGNISRLTKFSYFAATAVIVILLAIDIFTRYNATANFIQPLSTVIPKEMLRTVYTEKGVKAKITLPDSSVVWLNSDSKISYPVIFSADKRNIELSGEAFFDVKKDSLCPMIIKTNKDFYVEVFGTSFNIKSYDNDSLAHTTLFSGSIAMHYKDYKDGREKTIKLKPDDSFTFYDKGSFPILSKIQKTDKSNAWIKGELFFDQTPMKDVIKMLERWHGTTFIIRNNSIFDDKLTASFQSESIIQIMEMMKYCIAMDYEIHDNTVIIN